MSGVTPRTITSLVPRALVREARLLGMDPVPLLAAAGLGTESAADADVHIDIDRYHQLWDLVMTMVGDPGFPIRAGSAFRIEDNEVFGFLAMSCETLGEAFARTARYRDLYNTGARWELQPDGPRVRLIWYPWPGDRRRVGVRAAIEFGLADMVSAGSQLSGTQIRPVEVRLAHAAPPDTSAHRQLFGREPRYDMPLDELVLDAAVLALPVASFNSRLREYFDEQCKQLAPRFATDAPIASQVRRELIAAMDGGDPSMSSVARRLGMSGRSLHRRLAEERSGFDSLLDDVRHEFAKRYLAQGSVSASEVAYLIGFQSPTAFFRAFKRWTGDTPRSFQRSSS
jgi:AraC-like DNA-binding protein